nr:MAG TPA: Large subunit terminase [Caudoviricetes sp.]
MSIASLAQHARHPGKLCVYVAPTHQMCRQIMWKPLKNMLLDRRWVKRINESNLEIELVNGSIIMLRSADNPDRLRGISISHCVIDEAADIAEETWYEVIRPALADQQGSALIISTPKGKGWLWDLFSKFKNNKDWLCHSYTTAEGGIVTVEEIENAKQTMGEREFKQEFLAEWVDFANRIYYSLSDANIVEMPAPDPRSPLHIGMDFNVDPGCAVVAYQHNGGYHVFDEIEMYGTNTHEMVAEIERRYPSRKKYVYPDASGSQRRSSANGITDHIILKNAGYQLCVGSINPAVADRIAAVNSAFRSMDGTIRLTIEPKCRKLIECLEKHTYKENTRQPAKDTGFDHFNDALGYLVNHQLPIRQQISGYGGPIRRSTGSFL